MNKLLTLAAAVIVVAIAAWLLVPRWRETVARTAACQAVIDQARRQIDNPGSAIFPDCQGDIDNPDNTEIFVFRDANAADIWHIMGKLYDDTSGDGDIHPTRFQGDAWRTLDGWEADVYIFQN